MSFIQQELLDRVTKLERAADDHHHLEDSDDNQQLFDSKFPINSIMEMDNINIVLKNNDNFRKYVVSLYCHHNLLDANGLASLII